MDETTETGKKKFEEPAASSTPSTPNTVTEEETTDDECGEWEWNVERMTKTDCYEWWELALGGVGLLVLIILFVCICRECCKICKRRKMNQVTRFQAKTIEVVDSKPSLVH